ncbi:MAG TPA: hypothetical protein DDY20_03195 [Desulfobulbaceae bacterium]|nr:hypothetical protein [Desulfobulbaceae bacterium]
MRFLITAAILALTLLAQPAFAQDEVLRTVEEAVSQYKNGDFAGAASNLDYASQLIRQKKSEQMKSLLPEPLAGWLAEPASAQALGTAVFGGGITVSRSYSKPPSSLSIDIVSDSPLLQSLVMMLNNPMFVGASGGKLEAVKGQRAIVKFNEGTRSGDLNIVVDNRFMITVKGQKIAREDLLAYAGQIDFTELAKK